MSYDELDEEFENTFGYSGRDEGYDDDEMDDMIWKYEERMDKKLSNKAKNNNPQNGCYIATCVYGSYDCPEVWTLRRFRDLYLSKSFFGRFFIRIYYKISPAIVSCFGKNKSFKKFFKLILDTLVTSLQNKGYSSQRYFDQVYIRKLKIRL